MDDAHSALEADPTPIVVAEEVPEPLRWARSRKLLRTPTGIVGLALMATVILGGLLAGVLAPGDPFASAGPALQSPSFAHLMGTDNFGRDILAGVLYGARTSLIVVFWVLLISSTIGLLVGAIAGYRGGAIDDLLMRCTEMLQSLPGFFLALLVVSLFGSSLHNLVIFLGLTSWSLLAKVVRSEALSMKKQGFVEAAKASGSSGPRILFVHILPNVLASAIVVMALIASRTILIETSLAFLGLGDRTRMSWGLLLDNATSYLRVAWWMSVFPGLAIVVAVLGLNLLGDAVNDVLNPSLVVSSSRRLRRRMQAAVAAESE